MVKPFLRLIGDVHGIIGKPAFGHERCYLELIREPTHSIQLGDCAITPFTYYAPICKLPKYLTTIDPNNHKILLGNHDNYDVPLPNYLGDYGVYTVGSMNIFYVRGAFSIDRAYRTEGKSWWAKEQLTYAEGCKCLEEYGRIKPSFVISHDAPIKVISAMGRIKMEYFLPSITNNILQKMFEIHQPALWVFAHHHMDWQQKIGGTQFVCLNELSYMDFDENGKINTPMSSE